MSSQIRFEDVSYRAGGNLILSGVSLTVNPRETVALIGRSGAGKSSALRMINGLLFPSEGLVTIDGKRTDRIDLIEHRRRTGYIIQGAGLFPHRTVFDNVATVPRLLKWDDERVEETVGELLSAVSLPPDTYRQRYPRSLSGGEKQRVGIARALAGRPGILLCDEPFGAVDPIVRLELQNLLMSLRERLDATVVFVTHDLREALRVAERIVLIDGGSIEIDISVDQVRTAGSPLFRAFAEAAGGFPQ